MYNFIYILGSSLDMFSSVLKYYIFILNIDILQGINFMYI